ncbi:homoprotocatechuate degradation operon regulator HpaR [Falsirhodobacter sp. 20TX0035]|uniref:homoprotocatechuate degradation operon regulator HpaR n=1 Tax=Falsirhodobacter sp. 20TX0035 TaxID=3022019 RepID=UPI00232C6053|nr:homoprotocatechuate degradation operon regulator HpaR [Falsirhodobacter sp. 20TX0035]MDB6454487.1 homoprotocatechuate degradation operon regulator HpaR [Falsirhodobacter sp. 20TX0035]
MNENEIRWTDPGMGLPMALLRAREAVLDGFRPLLNAHDLTEQQWRVMRLLEEAGTVDASALARGTAILAPSLTRILRTLERRGVVALARDPGDARRQQIRLTDQGRALTAKMTSQSAAIHAALETALGAARIDRLLAELDALTARIRRPGA